MMFDLSDRGICITGGGGHIGRALALRLAHAGAKVVICGRTRSTLEEAVVAAESERVKGSVTPVVADVSTERGVDVAIGQVCEVADEVHGWVNNAYSGTTSSLADVESDHVIQTLWTALGSVILATQAVGMRMAAGGGGAIVNIASMYGLVSPRPRIYEDYEAYHSSPAYGAAKAGLIQFTRYAACEFARMNVRVNAISPGPFPSPTVLGESIMFAERLAEQVPLGRVGQPSELAGAAVFLLSDESSYVTGHNLVVDGGWTAW